MGLFSRLADEVRLLGEHLYDWRRYRRESFVLGAREQAHRQAMLHILAHSLEHGMALPEPRPGFGVEKAASLMRKTEAWLAAYGPHPSARAAFRALEAWAAHHRAAGQPMAETEAALDRLDAAWALRSGPETGGVEQTGRARIAAAAEGFDFSAFLRERHSVRQYAPDPVDPGLIRGAVADAQTAPSVCNRQTCRAYAFTRRRDIGRLLALQSGNAGFSQEVPLLFVVTADTGQMNLLGERYQGWIDGGLFAMTLALALHARGLGACFLNWSVPSGTDRRLRRLVGIPDSELVITMMAAGHLKEHFDVPVSQRKPLEAVLVSDPPLRTG
jgi:nitroreductase